jgi:hypothetical protein
LRYNQEKIFNRDNLTYPTLSLNILVIPKDVHPSEYLIQLTIRHSEEFRWYFEKQN